MIRTHFLKIDCGTEDYCVVVSDVWAGLEGNKTKIDVKDCSLVLATNTDLVHAGIKELQPMFVCLVTVWILSVHFRSYQSCKNFLAALSMIHKGCLLDYDVDYQCEVIESYLIMQGWTMSLD